MSDDKKSHNKQNREFLHDIATPMTILRLSLKRLSAIQDGTAPAEDIAKQPEIFKRAMTAMQKLEDLHANFKLVLHARETEEDSKAS